MSDAHFLAMCGLIYLAHDTTPILRRLAGFLFIGLAIFSAWSKS